MKTITLRVADELAESVAAVASARGLSVSEFIRDTLELELAPREALGDRSAVDPDVPASLTTVERHQIATLHRILAAVSSNDDASDERKANLERAEIMEHGYVSQYDDVFVSLESEMSLRDADLVMDVLDMFTDLEWSIEQLSEEDRASLGEQRLRWATFDGFDLNSRREGRLLSFARHLIDEGRWERLADRFGPAHERGNSHGKRADRYERMVEVHRPIARKRARDMRDGGLRLDEIMKILDAAVHPSNRGR